MCVGKSSYPCLKGTHISFLISSSVLVPITACLDKCSCLQTGFFNCASTVNVSCSVQVAPRSTAGLIFLRNHCVVSYLDHWECHSPTSSQASHPGTQRSLQPDFCPPFSAVHRWFFPSLTLPKSAVEFLPPSHFSPSCRPSPLPCSHLSDFTHPLWQLVLFFL